MNGFEQVIGHAAALSQAHSQPRDGDYTGPDGLLYCGKCHTKKQCRVNIDGKKRVVGCLCRCAAAERDKAKRQADEAEREYRRRRMLRVAIQNSMLRDARFETACPSPLIDKAKNYVRNWEIVRENNVGLLLMGGVGVGKSYAAACICNALLDQGISCRMTSFGRILSMDWEERGSFISTLGRCDLLVLDDLGAERSTEFADEIIFSVVDERYRAKKPLIVTTNLGLPELKNPLNITKDRVYDRLLEICGPVLCEGDEFRRSAGAEKRRILRDVLRCDTETAAGGNGA